MQLCAGKKKTSDKAIRKIDKQSPFLRSLLMSISCASSNPTS